MQKTKTIIIESQEIIGFTCNCCGKESSEDDVCSMNDITSLSLSGSYGSYYPSDCSSIEFDVCGRCLEAWIKTFKHEPAENSWF